MHTLQKTILGLTSLVLSVFAFAGTPSSTHQTVSVDSVIAYLNQLAAVHQHASRTTAPIKSRSDLASWKASGQIEHSALSKLTPSARRKFLSSITFNARGISGYRYDVLESELTPTQIYSVLRLFGAQGDVKLMRGAHQKTKLDTELLRSPILKKGDDYKDYRCVERASCEYEANFICMHSC